MRKLLMVLMLAVALTSAGGCASKKPKPGPSQSTEVNNGADTSGAGSDSANAGNAGSRTINPACAPTPSAANVKHVTRARRLRR